jgi:hypothetical protein
LIELQDQNNDIGFVSEKKRKEKKRERERESEGKKVKEIKDTS